MAILNLALLSIVLIVAHVVLTITGGPDQAARVSFVSGMGADLASYSHTLQAGRGKGAEMTCLAFSTRRTGLKCLGT